MKRILTIIGIVILPLLYNGCELDQWGKPSCEKQCEGVCGPNGGVGLNCQDFNCTTCNACMMDCYGL